MTKLNEKGFNKAYWEFTNAIGFPEAFQKTTSEKLETAILAYLPHHESELVKALESQIEATNQCIDNRYNCTEVIGTARWITEASEQALAKYKEGQHE